MYTQTHVKLTLIFGLLVSKLGTTYIPFMAALSAHFSYNKFYISSQTIHKYRTALD